jgi:phenylacetate-CoA ligase
MTVGHAAVAYWLARDARGAMRAPDLDAASLRALSAKRMLALLTDAQRSPFHGERMRAAGLSRPEALRVAELPLALQSLPPVTKHELRDAGVAALRDGRPSASWFSSRSSGSSGEPFRVYYDSRAWSMLKYLVKMRARRAAGMHLMDRVAILDAIDRGDEGRSLLERAGRLRRISVFRQPEEIAAALAAFAPAEIYALPSALLEVARACSAGAPRVRARRIFTSGELLTGAARHAITAAFGGSLYDVYGTSETKEIAWECSAGSRHINADVVHVEVLEENGALALPGTEGEIVVTVLVNRAMPLIRYRTGDRGVLLGGRCACGRESPLLGIVSGREADVLELTDGSTISPYMLTMALEPIAGLAQYQVVQAERDLLHVNAIADGSRDPTTLASAIVGALRGALPCSMRVDAEVVAQLERGSRAKLRVVQPLPRARDSVASLATTAGHAP